MASPCCHGFVDLEKKTNRIFFFENSNLYPTGRYISEQNVPHGNSWKFRSRFVVKGKHDLFKW